MGRRCLVSRWIAYEVEPGCGGNVPKADGKAWHHECADRLGMIDSEGFPVRGVVSGPYSWGEPRACAFCGDDVSHEPRTYSDDYRPCQCGSEVFAKYDVIASPSMSNARLTWVDRSEVLCARCQRKPVLKAVSR